MWFFFLRFKISTRGLEIHFQKKIMRRNTSLLAEVKIAAPADFDQWRSQLTSTELYCAYIYITIIYYSQERNIGLETKNIEGLRVLSILKFLEIPCYLWSRGWYLLIRMDVCMFVRKNVRALWTPWHNFLNFVPIKNLIPLLFSHGSVLLDKSQQKIKWSNIMEIKFLLGICLIIRVHNISNYVNSSPFKNITNVLFRTL